MINRINLILRAKNITAKQFAEEIGIQPSGMSHILNGRNNPSLEFVNKVIRRYPEIDANWLLLGKGEMYGRVERGERRVASGEYDTPTLFSESLQEPAESPLPATTPLPEPQYEAEPLVRDMVDEECEQAVERTKEELAPFVDKGRKLVRILFFYDDRTFEEYRPE